MTRLRNVTLARVFCRTGPPCHIDPVAGESGGFVANALTSEGTQSADFDDPQLPNERGSNQLFGSGLAPRGAVDVTASAGLYHILSGCVPGFGNLNQLAGAFLAWKRCSLNLRL